MKTLKIDISTTSKSVLEVPKSPTKKFILSNEKLKPADDAFGEISMISVDKSQSIRLDDSTGVPQS